MHVGHLNLLLLYLDSTCGSNEASLSGTAPPHFIQKACQRFIANVKMALWDSLYECIQIIFAASSIGVYLCSKQHGKTSLYSIIVGK